MFILSGEDASIYSDLYKDVYGVRPRNFVFSSVEEYKKTLNDLNEDLNCQLEQEQKIQEKNWAKFVKHVEMVQQTTNCDRKQALLYIADGEGLREDLKFYGWETLEYEYNIKYGSIKEWLDEK